MNYQISQFIIQRFIALFPRSAAGGVEPMDELLALFSMSTAGGDESTDGLLLFAAVLGGMTLRPTESGSTMSWNVHGFHL